MERDWSVHALGELIDVRHGWAFKGEQMSDIAPSGPIVVAIGNFDYSGGFRFSETRIKRYVGPYPTDYELSEGDILLAMTCQTAGGEILGIPGRIPSDHQTYLHNQRLGRVLIKEDAPVDSDYLYWLFCSPSFNRHLYVHATGTKILHTSPTKILSFSCGIPSLEEQKAIAGILDSLDKKMKVNRQINETLEAMAQALFKSWFVDFDPVIDNALAAGNDIPESLKARAAARQALGDARKPLPEEVHREFPDEFEFRDEMGWVPRGWIVRPVGEVFRCFDSKRIPLSKSQREAKKPGVVPYYGATSVMDRINEYIFDGIYLLVGEDGSVVKSDGSPFVQYIWKKSWVNNHAHVLQGAESVSTEHLVLYMRSQNVSAYVTGAVQMKITQGNLKSIPFLFCGPSLNKHFADRIDGLFAKQRQIHSEAASLQSIRDTLLPKLLSGELTIPDAEKLAADAL